MNPSNGLVEPIVVDDLLYRRLAPLHVNADGTVNSAAFKLRGRPDPHISVDLGRLTTPETALARTPRPGFALGALVARDPRFLGLIVRHDPLADNPAHTLIEGQRPDSKQSARRLAEVTTVLVPPER